MSSVEATPQHRPDSYIRRVVITVVVVGLVYLAWQVRDVSMIVFGGILVATLLTTLAGLLTRFISLPQKAAVAIVVLLLLLIFGLVGWWVGDTVVEQFSELRKKLPSAIEAFQDWLAQLPGGAAISGELEEMSGSKIPWADVAGYTGTALGGLANFVLILALGLYFAVSPQLYWRGFIRLIPPAYRKNAEAGLASAAGGLKSWLLGQLFTMVAIGILTTIGLLLLGIPLAVPLGILAGLLEFVPFIGPVLFGVLATLMAFSEGPTAALHVALLTIALQQLEGDVLTPLIQKRVVSLPPVLSLVAVLIFAALFGIPGILFATPLMVVVMILVQRLYIEHALEGAQIADK